MEPRSSKSASRATLKGSGRGCFARRERRRRRQPEGRAATKTRGSDVILVDTVGDLAKLCAAGDLVFVGGTIAELGGHNVIEPAHFARPIVIGPHYKNQKSIVSTFLVDDALVVVPDAAGFVDAILELYENRARATEMGERAAAVVGKNQASGDATLAALRRLLLSD